MPFDDINISTIFIILLTRTIVINIHVTTIKKEISGSNVHTNKILISIESCDTEYMNTSTSVPVEEIKHILEHISSIGNPMYRNSTKLIEKITERHNSVLGGILNKIINMNLWIIMNNQHCFFYPQKYLRHLRNRVR